MDELNKHYRINNPDRWAMLLVNSFSNKKNINSSKKIALSVNALKSNYNVYQIYYFY